MADEYIEGHGEDLGSKSAICNFRRVATLQESYHPNSNPASGFYGVSTHARSWFSTRIKTTPQSLRNLAHASSRSWSILAKQKRSRFSPWPGRKKAEPATAATPVTASRWRAFSAAVLPRRRVASANT